MKRQSKNIFLTILILLILGALISFFIKNNRNTNKITEQENRFKETTVSQYGDWEVLAVKNPYWDYMVDVYLVYKNDLKESLYLGTSDPFLYERSAVFLDNGKTVMFIQTGINQKKKFQSAKRKNNFLFYSKQ